MTILVTGASGFLGGRLVQKLTEEKKKVRILARKTSDLSHLEGLEFETIRGDLKEPKSLMAAVEGVELIYHCAGLSSDWAPWDEFYEVNVAGVQKLLSAAREAKTVKRVLHVSTTDVYGYPKEPPSEEYGARDIGLPYNRSKGLGEKAVWEFHEISKLPVTVVRPVSIYGPRSKDFVVEIANLLLQGSMMFVNGGNIPAGLLYIDNAVEGLIKAANSDAAVGKAYNLRDPENVTWRQYVDQLAEGLGTKKAWLNIPEKVALLIARGFEGGFGALKISSRPLLTRHSVYLFCRDQGYPIDNARKDIGYEGSVNFAEGLKRTLAWLDTEAGKQAVPRS